ncbi:MAG: hypothetical protein ACXWK6_07825 [Myxococcaceae bacterium]
MRPSMRRVLVVVLGLLGACGPSAQPSAGTQVPASTESALGAAHGSHAARVLHVGKWKNHRGEFQTVQAAVDAAKPGDWILIGPGDYHEQGAPNAGVLVTTPNLHLRGMDRNKVVIDGTRPGASTCSKKSSDQDFGPSGTGRNGIQVEKTDGVVIENLTACNFIGGADGENGNQIWWNGGDGSGVIGMGSYSGSHLTASNTWFDGSVPNTAQYGIFASNARGPGLIEWSYASNMGDSAFYVGACTDCDSTLRHVHAQNSALGYSGTNAGGRLRIEESEWDLNRSGILPSSLANDDPPSPQDGACPNAPGRSCTFIQRNDVHDNNNPNTPAFGLTAGSPIGTGIDLSGGRNNTVRDNRIVRNGSWGILINDYPDPDLPSVPAWCTGGDPFFNPPPPFDQILGPVIPCYFHAYGNRVEGNTFSGNGFFGNPTNGDLGVAQLPFPTSNCFHGNVDRGGPATSWPPALPSTCDQAWNPDIDQIAVLFTEVLCAAFGPASGACNGSSYPVPGKIALLPIPHERGMKDPCEGVPGHDPWCNDKGHDDDDDD